MSGTELIMGMEEVVQHIRELEEREKNLKEALAQKFYDHYDQMNYNKLNIARTVGPNLGRMVEHLIKENKRLQGENESLQEELEKSQMSDKSARMTLSETIDKLEMAKEIAYQCGVELFCDDDSSDED